MKLTPLEIKKQEFKRAMRGYDPDEVRSFLDMVADNYEEMQLQIGELKKQLDLLHNDLENYVRNEKTLKATMVNMQKTLEQSRSNSQREAELVIKEAEMKAAEIREKAKNDVDRAKDEIRLLRSQKESLVKRLRHLLSSHLELIDMLEIEEPEIQTENRIISRNKPTEAKQPLPGEKKKIQVSGILNTNKTMLESSDESLSDEIDKIIENLEKQKRKK